MSQNVRICMEFHLVFHLFYISSYFKFVNCFELRGQKVKECRPDHLDKITDFVNSVAANSLPLLCGDYIDGSDKCLKLEAPPKKDKSVKRTKSFVAPFIDVFNSFEEISVY